MVQAVVIPTAMRDIADLHAWLDGNAPGWTFLIVHLNPNTLPRSWEQAAVRSSNEDFARRKIDRGMGHDVSVVSIAVPHARQAMLIRLSWPDSALCSPSLP